MWKRRICIFCSYCLIASRYCSLSSKCSNFYKWKIFCCLSLMYDIEAIIHCTYWIFVCPALNSSKCSIIISVNYTIKYTAIICHIGWKCMTYNTTGIVTTVYRSGNDTVFNKIFWSGLAMEACKSNKSCCMMLFRLNCACNSDIFYHSIINITERSCTLITIIRYIHI